MRPIVAVCVGLRWDVMITCTAGSIYDPVRTSEANRIRIAKYLALSDLVGTFFALDNKRTKA